MRGLKAAVLLVLCAAGAAAQGVRPLEASLRRGVGEASFFVDQPAYVAVFELIPGMGVQQVFPRSSYQAKEPVQPGEYLLSRPFRSAYGSYGWSQYQPYARPMYMLDPRGRIVSYYYTTGWAGGRGTEAIVGPTRTYLLVASRAPLRLVGSPDAARHWLQQVIGFRAISSAVFAPNAMLTDIVDAVMPLGAGVDDIVVDVLEISDYEVGMNRWSGQSIAFVCPGGVVSIPAEFFFGAGVFYCPVDPRAGTPTSTQPPPSGDSASVEPLNPRARKVPDKYQVEENAVLHRRAITSTPVAPQGNVEEGYRPYRGEGGNRQEEVRAFGRGVWTTGIEPRATISVGLPIEPVGGRRVGGDITMWEAYIPHPVRSVMVEQSVRGRWNGGDTRSPTSMSGASSPSGVSSYGGVHSTSVPSTTSSSPSSAAPTTSSGVESVGAARPATTTTVPPNTP
jgi:hypothetical protein